MGPADQNDFDRRSKPMRIASMMTYDAGRKRKLVPRKVVVKSSGDEKVYGYRSIMTLERTSFADFVQLRETGALSMLPTSLVAEIRKNIRDGAKLTDQKWKNALELVHKAYEVANVKRPSPEDVTAWQQYEKLIRYGVQQLADTRGQDADWRMTPISIREGDDGRLNYLPKRRVFVYIPAVSPIELDVASVDEAVHQMTNKLKRHGVTTRIESKDKQQATLSLWRGQNQVEQITIKDIS